MKVEIENRYLGQAISLLFDLPLRGKQSRHRTKFVNLLREQLKEVEGGRIELVKEFAEKDERGEPIVNGNQYKILEENKEEFNKEINELYKEKFFIEGGNYQDMLKTMKAVLLDCDQVFSGQQAEIYDYLCDQFEKV